MRHGTKADFDASKLIRPYKTNGVFLSVQPMLIQRSVLSLFQDVQKNQAKTNSEKRSHLWRPCSFPTYLPATLPLSAGPILLHQMSRRRNDFVVVTPPNSNPIDQAAPLAPNPPDTRAQATDSDNTISAADKEVERRSHERIAQLGAQERAILEARGGGSNTQGSRAEETIGNEVDARSTRTSSERIVRPVDPEVERCSRERIAQLVAREEAIRAARSVDPDTQAPAVDVKTAVDREVSSSDAAGVGRVPEVETVPGEDGEFERSRGGENAVEITGVSPGVGARCAC